MEITAEQLRELIIEEEQINEIAQAQSDQLDRNASAELVNRVMNTFPIILDEWENHSPLDRIIYSVRGAYIFGYMCAIENVNDTIKAFVADFIGEHEGEI